MRGKEGSVRFSDMSCSIMLAKKDFKITYRFELEFLYINYMIYLSIFVCMIDIYTYIYV